MYRVIAEALGSRRKGLPRRRRRPRRHPARRLRPQLRHRRRRQPRLDARRRPPPLGQPRAAAQLRTRTAAGCSVGARWSVTEPASGDIGRHAMLADHGADRRKRHLLGWRVPARHPADLTLDQRVRGSSPWRRTTSEPPDLRKHFKWSMTSRAGQYPVSSRTSATPVRLSAAAAVDRLGATPWRMTAAEYTAALTLGDTDKLRGTPTTSHWDPALAAALAAVGRSWRNGSSQHCCKTSGADRPHAGTPREPRRAW